MRRLSRPLALIVDAGVASFSAWSIAYHIVLFARLPAYSALPIWLLLLGAVSWRFRKPLLKGLSSPNLQIRLGLPAVVVGAILALWSACVYMPFLDNYEYLHRALWQFRNFGAPYAVHTTSLFNSGLPPLSDTHLISSVEMLGASSAWLLHLDPLWTSMTLIPAVTVFIGICGVGLLGQFLGLGRAGQTLLLIGFAVASIVGGDVLRTIGSFGLPRVSEGKCVLAFAGIPLAYLYAVRLIKCPSADNWILLCMLGMCFVGWSSSGIFLFPALILFVAVSTFHAPLRFRLAIMATAIYPLIIYAAARWNRFPKVHDMRVWSLGWPARWDDNLNLIARSPAHLLVQIGILSLGVLVCCKRKDRWLAAVPLFAIIILFNPLMGPFAIRMIPPAAFFRLGYLMAAPIGIGLCLAAAATGPTWRRLIGVGSAISSVALALPFCLPGNLQIELGSPVGYKWWPKEVGAAEVAGERLSASRLLAPERLACFLAMENPTLVFDSIRPHATLHLFRNSNFAYAEGEDCANAESFIEGKISNPAGLRRRVAMGLRQIIVTKPRAFIVMDALGYPQRQVEVEDLGHDFELLILSPVRSASVDPR